MVYRLIKLSTIILVLLLATDLRAQSDNPWRLSNALKRSDTFVLTGTHRSRYEALDGQFRAGGIGKDDIFVTRTTLKAQLNVNRSQVVIELMDSRQHLADGGSPLNSTIVNPLELLQAYIAFKIPNTGRDVIQFKLGRHTMDLGSRRLVARNLYRNTINNFTKSMDKKERNKLYTNISVSIISQYVRKVSRIPLSGLKSTEKCIYEVSIEKQRDTIFSTISGEGLNSYGNSKLDGPDGFQQSLLKAFYRSLRDKREMICDDYGRMLDECQSVFEKKTTTKKIISSKNYSSRI